ncbi:hypothetical protein [Pseudomonas atacamensis]|uniref:hypothetical protein n=1 Tax=Pseudomonas atacamensis TaxID=2565368 RepID=UPI001F1873BD|nr:hypothetical protein [Pseudomonas atacamensis]
MSRFNFCDCPAGFSASPERHAPDCPGRFGAGKAPTPVPATLPASQLADSGVDFGIDGRSVRVSQEAYSIFLAREAAGREKIEALQQRLTATDERNDELSGMLKHLVDNPYRFTDAYRERITATLNPKPEPDFSIIGIERMPPMEYDEP